MDSIPPLKRCTKCGVEKPATTENFRKNKTGKYGLSSWCKSCFREYALEYAKRPDVVEKRKAQNQSEKRQQYLREYRRRPDVRERDRSYLREYLSDPDRLERHREHNRKYVAKTRSTPEGRARANANQKRHYSKPETKEHYREYRKRTDVQEKHRQQEKDRRRRPDVQEKIRIYRATEHAKLIHRIGSQARRARIRSAGGSFSKRDIEKLYHLQRERCWYCERKLHGNYHIEHRIPLVRGGSNDLSNIVLACPECNMSKHDKMPHEWSDRLL